MRPKVSVVIPIFGVEKYIERCARSLFEQTLDDMEFIFVDDCTKDRSVSILQEVMLNYPQRREQTIILRHDVNKGLPIARQTGIKVATGTYIAHCDSDDWVDLDMYRAMYEMAKRENADVVVCDYHIVSNANKIIKTYSGVSSIKKNEFLKNLLLQRNSWSLWNKIFKAELYNKVKYYPTQNMAEDMLLTLQLVIESEIIRYTPNVHYFYRYNPASLTYSDSYEKIVSRYQQSQVNTKKLIGYMTEKEMYDQYKEELVYTAFCNRNLIIPALYIFSNINKYVSSCEYSNFKILKSKYINARAKTVHILILSGLYSIGLWFYRFLKRL